MKVAIIGGGIAGLTAAYWLRQGGAEVTLFEATARVGGALRSARTDGYLVEYGPNTVQATPLLEELIEALGLRTQQIEAKAAARKRYVVREGKPVALPSSPQAFLTSDLFSLGARLRVLREPFVAPAPPLLDESMADFVRRRLGQEVLDYAVNPFVAGVFAGDPARLSLRHAFPRLHALEQQHGSLIKGAKKQAKAPTGSKESTASHRHIFSFHGGLQTLPDALANALGPAVRLNAAVRRLHREKEGWTLHVAGASSEEETFDAVLYAAPLHALEKFDFDAGLDLAPLLDVPHPPVSLLALGFRRAAVRHPLDGFGLLVPAVEKDFRILGVLFSSTLFPDRAPSGYVLLTVFVGGARHPELALASDDELAATVLDDLTRLLGIQDVPVFSKRILWEKAIPQYHLGYDRVTTLLDRLEERHAGLFFAGNYRSGISVGDAAASGEDAARRILAAGR